MQGDTHTEREGRVCVRAVHGSLSLTLTRPPPQQQPHTQQQEEAKEGRRCGRPRCFRHCRQASSYHLRWQYLLIGVLPHWPWELGGHHYLQDHHVIHSGWAAEHWQYSHPP
ncbi:hypothetical protein TcCL_NonESM11503 [Trypanosoma cruzi]|nr:hypothetical protein TcCL_NonESM11503 [Trypanosoma cruzi]